MPVDFDIECMMAKSLNESLLLHGTFMPPLLVVFNGMSRSASVLGRPLKDDQEDKQAAYQEMFSLVATTKADSAFFACDACLVFDTGTNRAREMKPSVHPDHVNAFSCITMNRQDKVAIQRTVPYVKTQDNQIYYIESAKLGADVPLVEGLVPDMLKHVFSMEESPFESLSEHIQLLNELGHHAIRDTDVHSYMLRTHRR